MRYKRELSIGIIFKEGSGAILKMLEPDFDRSHYNEKAKKQKDQPISLDACF